MARHIRLDVALVRRGLARSRHHALELVSSGRVSVAGMTATKPATAVDATTPVTVRARPEDSVVSSGSVVSRGAYKLAGALDAWPTLRVAARRCLDAGASTGGFTQVLLDRGAGSVVAVDVGYGQLHWSLRTDDRVHALDRTNVRGLTPGAIGGAVDVVVADLSFISLRLVLAPLTACTTPDGDLLLMVKPQFEAGRERVGSGGVVRDPGTRVDAVMAVADVAAGLGWPACGVVASPLPGPSGNVEYFLWLRRDGHGLTQPAVEAAVGAGPQ